MILNLLIILTILGFVFNQVLEYINYRSSKGPLPDDLADVYQADKYSEFISYKSSAYRFNLVTTVFSLILTLFLLWIGFGLLDAWVNEITDSQIIRGLLFFGILAASSEIVTMPFDIYETFVLEQKYGFNTTTWKTYLSDKLKSYFLAAFLGGGLLIFLFWLILSLEKNFWWLAWLGITSFSLFFTYFYSSLIVPIFNKQTPLGPGSLHDKLTSLSKIADFPLDDIFIIDGSKRSTRANAYFSGFGRKRRIVLYDTLLNQLNTDEIASVLAHEIGHYKLKHIQSGIVAGSIQTALLLFIFSLVLDNSLIYNVFGSAEGNLHIALIVYAILYNPVSAILSVLMNMLSQKFEYEADEFSARLVPGINLISGLKKLSAANLSNLTPHQLYVLFHHAHPTLKQRMDKILSVKD